MATDPATLQDANLVRNLMKNAERAGRADLVLQCQLRLAEIAGQKYDDQLEREFWTAVSAAEEISTQKNGRTTRLSRTRQKEKRVGVVQCLTDWALDPGTSQGFAILVDGGRPELTGEAIVLRNAEKFSTQAVDSARAKLKARGVDLSGLERPSSQA